VGVIGVFFGGAARKKHPKPLLFEKIDAIFLLWIPSLPISNRRIVYHLQVGLHRCWPGLSSL
jgi:hypothetical protein